MTDTHTHLYMDDTYADGGAEAVSRAIEAGVTRLVFPGVDMVSFPKMRRLHELFPLNTVMAAGIHPTELGDTWREDLDAVERMLPGDFAAIGEVGIDLHENDVPIERQKMAFARQIALAQRFGLPVIIHCRDGLEETLDVIKGAEGALPTLIFHSFTMGRAEVRRIREVCDPWFGINGVVTFKNAPLLRDALPEIGIDRILLETDSPWLSPAPLRGRVNESARIPFIRDCVAATLGISPEETERITDASASRIFNFPGNPDTGHP